MIWSELNISEDAKKMLDTIKDWKDTIEDLRKRLILYYILGFGSYIIFALLFYKLLSTSDNLNLLSTLAAITDSFYYMVLLIIFVTVFMMSFNLNKIISSKVRKLESLRLETIDRLNTTWIKTIDSEMRDNISKEINEKCGINLTFKS